MDLFTSAAVLPDQDDADPIEIVKQKFKTEDGNLDVAALAKAKVEADKFVDKLKDELSGIRGELDTRLSMEEFLDEIKSSRTASSDANNQSLVNEPNEPAVGIKQDDIMRLVKETINQERTQAMKDANRATAVQALQKSWGSRFKEIYEEKAQELNLSKEFLYSVAESNPQAFLKLVDASAALPREPDYTPPENTRRRDVSSGVALGTRDKAYYDKIKKADPRTYWSVKVQSQMHKDAQALGERFYPSS